MKIACSMNDEEFDKILPHIRCADWANPMEGEFVFYEPTNQFLVMLSFFDIEYYSEE
jgi:hypothetical protein